MDAAKKLQDSSSSENLSYKTWPMGDEFSRGPGGLGLRLAASVTVKDCPCYPPKKWKRANGQAGKDIPSSGMFAAKKDIKAGSIVFVEQPVVVADVLQNAVAQNQKKENGGTLSADAWALSEEIASSILERKLGGKEMWQFLWQYGKDDNLLPAQLCDEAGTPNLCSKFRDLPPITAAVLMNVIYATAIRMSTPVLRVSHGLALCMFGAGLNHSCDPNANVFVRQGGSKQQQQSLLVVKAVRTIKVGEEITIAYQRCVCSMPRVSQRRMVLQSIYNFECQCKRCRSRPESDSIMASKHREAVQTFGPKTVMKIKKAARASVQGGPAQSRAVFDELGSLWKQALGNGDGEALQKMDPLLSFDFSWAYIASLFMCSSASEFLELKTKGLGLEKAIDMLDSSMRQMIRGNYCALVWRFAKPLLEMARLVSRNAVWNGAEDRHLAFGDESTKSLRSDYKALEKAVDFVYDAHHRLELDSLISEIVMETGTRAMHLIEENEWLKAQVAEEMKKMKVSTDDVVAMTTAINEATNVRAKCPACGKIVVYGTKHCGTEYADELYHSSDDDDET